MKGPVRIFLGALLVISIVTLTQCAVGQRLRLIRRITASDLPPTVNGTSAVNITDLLAAVTQQAPSSTTNPNTPKTLNITEVFSTTRPLPAQLNITEILDTSATTHRRKWPVTTETVGLTTTETPKTNISEAQLRSRRPHLRTRTSLERKQQNTTETSTQSPILNETEITTSIPKDLNVAESISKSSNNETNSINPSKIDSEESVSDKPGNCTSNCEQKKASNEEKPVVLLNSTTHGVTKETQQQNVESTTVKPTDRTFNKIVSSSTAKVVLQENIHTDILKHLTSTVSYAHYETDYVLDLDDGENYEAESIHKKVATKPAYEHYDTHDDFNVTYTTPSSKIFDDAFARVSEGIRQNLDNIVDRSDEYNGGSNEHFSSSDTNERLIIGGIPKNETKVKLDFVNRLNVVSNDSATANSKHGDLIIDNGTHIDFERQSLETKVEPEMSSTVKYIIDDVYSTTRRIITQDEESNSIKEEGGSKEKAVDSQNVEGDDSGSEERLSEQRLEGSDSGSDETALDQRLEGAEDELVRVKADGTAGTTATSIVDEVKQDGVTENEREITTESVTTIRTSTQGRGRMFSTERFSSFNNNNAVEQTATEIAEAKRARGNRPDVDGMTTTYSPRSRTRISLTSSSTPSRRYSTDPISTSPRINIIRRPVTRRPNNSSRLGDLDINNEGNDIIANDNFRTTIRRGTVKFGNTRESNDNDSFPIPPTAAAWTLATMKEPGRRTKLQSVNTSTAKPTALEDSEASGSFSQQTTLYNVITQTSEINSTLKEDKHNVSYVGEGLLEVVVSTTEKIKPVDDAVVITTENPTDDVTTIEVPTTTAGAVEEDDLTTRQPDEVTTTHDVNEEIVDDEDLRFDGVSRTTTVHSSEIGEVTTEYDNVATTTESYETTLFPKEDLEKVVDEDKEEEGEVTTPVPESVLAEEGAVLDPQKGEGNQEGQPDINKENKDVQLGQKLLEISEESIPNINQDTQGIDAVKASEDVAQKEEGNTKTEGGQLEQGVPQGEEQDYGSPSGPETQTDVPIILGAKIAEVLTTLSTMEVTENQSESATTVLADAQSTSEMPTTGTPIEDDAEDDDSTGNNVTSDVHTFMRVFVEGSMEEFCSLMTIFKKAVADLLTEGTSRTVTVSQVIIRNIGDHQCADRDGSNTTTESNPGQLIPVEMHIIDEAGNYDQQLNDAFPLLWGHKDIDFQLRIRKVDVVDESPSYSGSTNSGAVIAAITISCIGAICLLILAVLLIVMRKRQKKVNYGMRCTPVSLDAYSLDSVSVHGSTRRKGGLRASKRSYGNPAFEDPVSPTHPMNFASLSNFSTERDGIEEEFSNIPHVTPKSDELPEGAETKNRYANVIPLPETRVVLSTLADEPLSDYINANYVRGPKKAIKCYIACQAPMQGTVTDFWRMVWEQQSKVIMMLTDLVENGVEKCADYLPPSEVLDCHRLFGDYQVTLKKREVRETYVISTLQLKNMESNSWREITHLWYLSWPLQGVPEEPSTIIAFLIEARSYMKNSSGPSIVHCSPGTGRAGTVLACDLCIREFEQTRLVDVPRCVYRLRKDRAGCVQTRDQYAFIYQVLNLYATKLTGGALDSI